MAQLDRRKFLQAVGLGSAVALLPRLPQAAEEGVFTPTGSLDVYFDEPNTVEVTIDFGRNLCDDADARYALFFADREDADGNPVIIQDGRVDGRAEVKFDVPIAYDGEEIICRAIGLKHASFTEGRMAVSEKPKMFIEAALERNYVN